MRPTMRPDIRHDTLIAITILALALAAATLLGCDASDDDVQPAPDTTATPVPPRNDDAGALDDAGRGVREGARDLRDRARDAADDAGDALRDARDRAADKLDDLGATSRPTTRPLAD